MLTPHAQACGRKFGGVFHRPEVYHMESPGCGVVAEGQAKPGKAQMNDIAPEGRYMVFFQQTTSSFSIAFLKVRPKKMAVISHKAKRGNPKAPLNMR